MNQSHSSTLNDELDGDTLHEECGVFGILGHPDAATLTALGLHALQHRGQEAAGIVTFDGSSSTPNGIWASSAITTPTRRPSPAPPRQHRDRPQPLFDHRRSRAPQRAAAVCRTRSRRHRHRPQRQLHQRPDAAPPADRRWRHLSVDLRYRSRSPPHRPLDATAPRPTASSMRSARWKAAIRCSR